MPVSAEMISYLSGSVVLCLTFKLTEVKPNGDTGDVIRMTTHTRHLVIDDELYMPANLQESQLQRLAGLEPDNLELTALLGGIFSSPSIRNKKWYAASVVMAQYNPLDVSMGYLFRRPLFVGQTKLARYTANAELRGQAQLLDQPVGEVTTQTSQTTLGDERCKIDLSGNTADGYHITNLATVTAVTDRQQFTVEIPDDIFPGIETAPDDFFRMGNAIFTSGENESNQIKILSNTGNNIILWLPVFYDIHEGDTVTLIAGCDNTREQCRDKFNNVINFRGFPDLPGADRVLTVPASPNA